MSMTDTERMKYRGRIREQMFKWVNGNPTHNHIDDECCPDFSCCYPDLFDKDLDSRRNRMQDTIKKWNK